MYAIRSYYEPLLSPDTLFVVISQSGETADTLETLKMAKAAGVITSYSIHYTKLYEPCFYARQQSRNGEKTPYVEP